MLSKGERRNFLSEGESFSTTSQMMLYTQHRRLGGDPTAPRRGKKVGSALPTSGEIYLLAGCYCNRSGRRRAQLSRDSHRLTDGRIVGCDEPARNVILSELGILGQSA